MIKKTNIRFLGLASLLAAAAASLGTASAQNPGFNQYNDLTLFFQKPVASGNNAIVNVALPTLSALRDQRGTDSYSILLGASALDTALASAFGTGWASDTQLYAGAVGNRGVSTAINGQFQTSGDSNRTLYYTQSRATTSSPGLQNSSPGTLSNNTILGQVNSDISQTSLRFEIFGTGNIWEDARADSFVDNRMPIGGVQFTALTNVGNFMSGTPFTFGGQSNVVLVLDLFRNAPVSTFNDGIDDTQLTPLFLGNLVLKSTGEVGFLTVPEPSSALLIGAAGVALAAVRRRRKVNA